MKKVLWFMLLASVSSVWCSAERREGTTLKQHREMLHASILYLRVRNTVESSGKRWACGDIKVVSDIYPATRNLIITAPGYIFGPDSTYVFKYLDDSQLGELGRIIESLSEDFYSKNPPVLWDSLCENAGVPKDQWSIRGAMAFLESCKE